MYIQGSLDK